MNKRSLKSEIKKKLEGLLKLLDKTDEVRVIDPKNSETWDSDTLYDLVELTKQIQKLLEDKIDPKQKDEFGESLISETGLCSLVDEYNEESKDDE